MCYNGTTAFHFHVMKNTSCRLYFTCTILFQHNRCGWFIWLEKSKTHGGFEHANDKANDYKNACKIHRWL